MLFFQFLEIPEANIGPMIMLDANSSRFFNEIAPTFLADLNPKNVRFALKKKSHDLTLFPIYPTT